MSSQFTPRNSRRSENNLMQVINPGIVVRVDCIYEKELKTPESKKKEDQNNHDISSANKAAGMSGHRGEKKMTRPPLLRLLRQKVFPVVQPRVSSSWHAPSFSCGLACLLLFQGPSGHCCGRILLPEDAPGEIFCQVEQQQLIPTMPNKKHAVRRGGECVGIMMVISSLLMITMLLYGGSCHQHQRAFSSCLTLRLL